MNRRKSGDLLLGLFTIMGLGTLFLYNGVADIPGIILLIGGLILWWTGRITLGSEANKFPCADKLITKGIYSKISSPMYIGTILAILGVIIMTRSIGIIILGLIYVSTLMMRDSSERKMLEKKFGKKYSKYKQKTWF
ncbi:hypothetical protein HOK51_07150 [Candidatus Woesearchaeota archaeon]|jgi:protein-S-isoprenylcysteine O-methyltransferase Ste14|nr:hypothetical protein [Candidatus Woesearchaeota archaeon]MBT6519598.1 hypothetical protein [Candidatus Woesearchaeota archaeon]MBT7367513.1 hypothetical protein [Candidatus Woesearchaeota archaeon]